MVALEAVFEEARRGRRGICCASALLCSRFAVFTNGNARTAQQNPNSPRSVKEEVVFEGEGGKGKRGEAGWCKRCPSPASSMACASMIAVHTSCRQ